MPSDLRYRFHGRVAPETGREPVRAFIEPSDTTNGVATMRLYDPIDSWGGDWGVSAKEFSSALDALDGSVKEIRLHINSPGGEVFEGIAILNALRNHPAKVTTVVDGLAASAASFIAMGGDEVVMGRNTQLMIHDAWGICIGNAADMRDLAGRLDHLSDNIAAVYAEKAGGTVADWRAAMLAETWYSADEAVSAGLADRVEQSQPKVENAFDLGVFTYAGREQAPDPALPTVNALRLPEVGDRVVIDPEHRHEPTHDTGTIAEVGTTAYGVVIDAMPEMGVHRWYTGDEFTLTQNQPDPAAKVDEPADDRMSIRHRMNARKVRAHT